MGLLQFLLFQLLQTNTFLNLFVLLHQVLLAQVFNLFPVHVSLLPLLLLLFNSLLLLFYVQVVRTMRVEMLHEHRIFFL